MLSNSVHLQNGYICINFAISDMTPCMKVTSLDIDREKQSHKIDLYTNHHELCCLLYPNFCQCSNIEHCLIVISLVCRLFSGSVNSFAPCNVIQAVSMISYSKSVQSALSIKGNLLKLRSFVLCFC